MSIFSASSKLSAARSPKAIVLKIIVILALIIGIKLYINSATAQDEVTTEDLHKKHPEKFHSLVSLSQGETHYEFINNLKSSSTVVLVHGVSGPMSSWDKTSAALNIEGYNTLRYDLYGRGFSERLETDYDLKLYVAQLSDLLKALNISGPIQLIGSSFGSVIASEFTLENLERVLSLTLIGPAGFEINTPFLAELKDVPLFGNVIFSLMGASTILEQNRNYFVLEKTWFEHRDFFKDQLQVKGSTMAILSTMRHSPVQNAIDIYAAIGATDLPVLVLWGEQDKTFPFALHETLQKTIPSQTFIAIPDSAHLPHYERPEFVNPYLLSFLDKYDSSVSEQEEVTP